MSKRLAMEIEPLTSSSEHTIRTRNGNSEQEKSRTWWWWWRKSPMLIVGLSFLFMLRLGFLLSDADILDEENNLSKVSDFLDSVSQSNTFCQQDHKDACVCKNPLEPSRPPLGTDYGDQWEVARKRNVDLADHADNPTVVFLGDSITEHFVGTELGEKDPNETENEALFQEFFGKDQKIPGLALGIAGDRCNNLLFRLQNGEMTSMLRPKLFWILVGTNDLGEDDCAVESIVGGVLAVIQEVQLQRPGTTIVVNSLLPRSIHSDGALGTEYWPSIQAINHMLKSFVEVLEGVHWFDASSLFLLTNDGTVMDTQLMPDLLHPSATGSRIWCREMIVFMEHLVDEWR